MGESKRVLITGASVGFGRDTAKALAERGHTVFASMRGVAGKNSENARALEKWAKDGNHKLHVVDLDVTDQASVDKGVTSVIAQGGIDVLLNNAGVGTFGIDEGFTADQARDIFDINVVGPIRMNRAIVPYMREAKKGLIVYVSSGLGRIVLPFMAIYTASKFAVEGYAESTSYELGPLGIESVIIQPGAYGTTFLTNSIHPKTDLVPRYGATAKVYEAFSSGFEARAKAGGLGDPSEVVRGIVEEVERPASKDRPLRRTIGQDVAQPVGAINKTCDQVQDGLLKAFGLK